MLEYYIGHQGQQLGPFSAEELQAKVAAGDLETSDLAWCEGLPRWQPLGRLLRPGAVLNPAALAGPDPGPAAVVLAAPWERIAAVLVDLLLALAAQVPLLLALEGLARRARYQDVTGTEFREAILQPQPVLGMICLAVLAGVQMWRLATHGQTLGKWLLRIRITRMSDEKNPGFVRAVLLRGIAGQLIPWFISVFFLFREDRRCPHDHLADTHVVRVIP